MKNRTLVGLNAALALSLAVRGVLADNTLSVSYNNPTDVYSQNFNSLWTNSNTPPVNLEPGAGAVVIGTPKVAGVYSPIDLTGPSQDFGPTIPALSTMTGWYAIQGTAGNSSPLKYSISDGSNASGSTIAQSSTDNATAALYGFYDPNNQGAGNNLALGSVAATETGNLFFGVRFVNNSSQNLNAITLSAVGQLFHQDTGAKALTFGYKVTTAATDIPQTGLTAYGGLNVGNFATGTAGRVTQSPSSTHNLSVIDLPLASTWAPGQALWITWQMGTGGSGQGLSIDDLSFSSRFIAPASTINWNLPGSGAWDTATPNWSGASSTFANDTYNVAFGNISSDATVTVQGGGVQLPQSMTITNSNTASTYTFAGGGIGGGFGVGVNISGAGNVKFTVANTYGLATNLNAGTLIVDSDNELGNNSVGTVGAVLSFNGGSLKLAGNLTSTLRPLTVTVNGGTFNTNGFNASFAGDAVNAVRIQGALHVSGGGNLTVGKQPSFGSNAAPAGSFIIDAGNTVTILGNTRANASDMFNGGVFNGNLILRSNGGARYNFDSPGLSNTNSSFNGVSHITGTGEIQVMDGSGWTDIGTNPIHNWVFNSGGVVISNTSGTYAAQIDVPIHLNPLNDSDPVGHPYSRLDVTTANFIGASNPNPTNSFGTVIGGTKNGTAGHGEAFTNLIINGPITGHSDINIGNDYAQGGSGDMTLLAHNTYDGVTIFSGGSATYLGIDDALPTGTDVVFGAFVNTGAGSIDLSGHNQHVRSIETANGSNAPSANTINNSGTTDSTLFVTGNITPFYPFTAKLNDGGVTVHGVTNTHTLALVKSGAGKLVLGIYQASVSKTVSTYSGGTTVQGGILQIAFDGALGGAAGPVTFDGGTIVVQNTDLQYDNSTTHETSTNWTSSRPITVTNNGGTINTPTFIPADAGAGTPPLQASIVFTGNSTTSAYNWGGPLILGGDAGSNMTIDGGTGTVSVSGFAAIQIGSNVPLSSGGSSDPFTDSVDSTKHVAIIDNGSFSITAGSKAIAGLSGTGTATVNSGTSLTSNGVTISGLWTINGSHTIRAGQGVAGTSKVPAVPTIAHTGSGTSAIYTGVLRLADSKLIVQSTDATDKSNKIASLNEAITAGSNGATWTGNGITSSIAQNDPNHYGVGVFDNAVLNKTSFGGQGTDTNSIFTTIAHLGDTNDNGIVDIQDISIVANNWQQSRNNWARGDLNRDGIVNIQDSSIIANNWQQTSSFTQIVSTLSLPGQSAAVPEPVSLALFAGILPLLAIRRRDKGSRR